jgi:hypothetical protein
VTASRAWELGRGPSSLASLGSVGQTHGNDLAVELNEAFAAQVIPIMDECDIPLGKLNAQAARSRSVTRSG